MLKKNQPVNDFEPLERLSRNQNLRKTQDPSQNTKGQAPYVCILLGLQQASLLTLFGKVNQQLGVS